MEQESGQSSHGTSGEGIKEGTNKAELDRMFRCSAQLPKENDDGTKGLSGDRE